MDMDERPVLWQFMRDPAFLVQVRRRLGYVFDSPKDSAEEIEAGLFAWERMPVDHPVYAKVLAQIRYLHGQYVTGRYTPVNSWKIEGHP
jgi:hypothetical protein